MGSNAESSTVIRSKMPFYDPEGIPGHFSIHDDGHKPALSAHEMHTNRYFHLKKSVRVYCRFNPKQWSEIHPSLVKSPLKSLVFFKGIKKPWVSQKIPPAFDGERDWRQVLYFEYSFLRLLNDTGVHTPVWQAQGQNHQWKLIRNVKKGPVFVFTPHVYFPRYDTQHHLFILLPVDSSSVQLINRNVVFTGQHHCFSQWLGHLPA